jgi:hypothetical protein
VTDWLIWVSYLIPTLLFKVVIQGEDSFIFEDIGDNEHQGELPQARSVDRQKTVSFCTNAII